MSTVVRFLLLLSLGVCEFAADSDDVVTPPADLQLVCAHEPPGQVPALPPVSEELAEVWKLEGQDNAEVTVCLLSLPNIGPSAQFAERLTAAAPASRHLLTLYRRLRV